MTQMNDAVVAQEPVVARIAEQSENVTQDVTNANVHLDGAIVKARSRNRKKWWCLLICSKLYSEAGGVALVMPVSTSTLRLVSDR